MHVRIAPEIIIIPEVDIGIREFMASTAIALDDVGVSAGSIWWVVLL